ncbi:hypothetical protein SB724_19210 [Bacillus sp. SIMBA_031]|uniref:hypothetical protein n=1 Tax=Bacillus sp. SIMBA_031 TaxID=3085774 RepID=UPI003979E928
MFKKNKSFIRILSVVIILLILIQNHVSAASTLTYESDADRYHVAFDLPEDADGYKVTQTNTNGSEVTNNVINERTPGHYFRCNGKARIDFLNTEGKVIKTESYKLTEIKSEATACHPQSDSDGGGSSGNGGSGGDCDICQAFSCPGWSKYIGKLDEIKSAIPPTPDWHKVADIFSVKIVDRLLDGLGKAPSPPNMPERPKAPARPSRAKPKAPAELSGVDDHNISKKEPQMKDNKKLKDSGFNKDDIKKGAKKIKEKKDTEKGFKLDNPVEALPDLPTDDLPIPGKTNAGEYDKQPETPKIKQPKEPEQDIEIPTYEEPETPKFDAPTPNTDASEIPSPADAITAPNPGGDDGDSYPTYKKQPD